MNEVQYHIQQFGDIQVSIPVDHVMLDSRNVIKALKFITCINFFKKQIDLLRSLCGSYISVHVVCWDMVLQTYMKK